MATLTFDVDQFRLDFPEFADSVAFPDSTLQAYWDVATCYISDNDYGCLAGDCRQRAINLMTAHLCKISTNAAAGKQTNHVQSSSIDKVSVTATAPPTSDQFTWWLSLTPYGMQLQALASAAIAGGFYVGGNPEKSAFRKVGGYFN